MAFFLVEPQKVDLYFLWLNIIIPLIPGKWNFLCEWKQPLGKGVWAHVSTLIPAWISNCIHYNVWDEISYPSQTSTVQPSGLGSSKVLVLGTWYLMQNFEYLVLTCTWHLEIQKYLVLTCTWRQSTWYLSKYFQQGVQRSGKSHGNSRLGKSQGKVREFCWRSGKKKNIGKSQGKVREFALNAI